MADFSEHTQFTLQYTRCQFLSLNMLSAVSKLNKPALQNHYNRPKKQAFRIAERLVFSGASNVIRTRDLILTKDALCRLSYRCIYVVLARMFKALMHYIIRSVLCQDLKFWSAVKILQRKISQRRVGANCVRPTVGRSKIAPTGMRICTEHIFNSLIF
jgi:hypothetical protein